jgi:glutathione S-transferase
MLQVLGRASSINVRKVLWTCAEIGVPYEHHEWGAGTLSLQSPEFLALNPNGMVPVIKDEAFVLRESNTICRYLASRHGRDDLLPTAAAARARVEQWMDWQATELNNAWRYAFMSLVRHSPVHADAAALGSSVRGWNRHMSLLDAELARTGAFVTGAGFTLADVVLGLSTHRWYSTPMDRPALPAVESYYERLSLRPGFVRHGRNGTP